MKTMEGPSTFGLDAVAMCIVPGVQIPAKYKVPSFEKYKGAAAPERTSEHTAGRWLRTLVMRNYSCTSYKTTKWGFFGMVHAAGEYGHPDLERPR